MKIKFMNPELHATKGQKTSFKFGLTGRIVTGAGYSKKAGSKYHYINFNKEGKTNLLEWL